MVPQVVLGSNLRMTMAKTRGEYDPGHPTMDFLIQIHRV